LKISIDELKRKLQFGTAIYISDDFMDVASAVVSEKGIKAVNVERYPFSANIKQYSYMEARGELDAALAKAFPNPTVQPSRVAVNLKSDTFLLRRFPVQKSESRSLSKTVAFEIQKDIPYPIEDLAFNFKVCEKRKGETEVLFAASEKKYINDVLSFFLTEHGMLPSAIETAPAFIASGVTRTAHILNKAYLSVHYEPANRVLVTGILNKEPHFFRELGIPSVSQEETERPAEFKYPTLKELWPMIEQDIVGTIEYLKKEASRPIEKILISGFAISGDEQIIANELGIPLERIDLTKMHGIALADKDRYLPVLSLLDASFGKTSLNLAPQDFTYQDFWMFRPVLEKAVITLSVILLAHFFMMGMILLKNNEVRSIKQEAAMYKLMSTESTRDEINRLQTITQQQAAAVSNALGKRVLLTEKLVRLGEDFNERAWVNNIIFSAGFGKSGDNLFRVDGSIYGSTEANTSEVNKIAQQMKNDKIMMTGFNDVKLLFVKRKKIGDKEVTEYQIVLR